MIPHRAILCHLWLVVSVLRSGMAILRPERVVSGLRGLILGIGVPERADFRPEKADLRSERADLKLERADLRPEKANFRPEGPDFGLRTESPNLLAQGA